MISGSVQQPPQKLDVTSFFALVENICRHRRSLDPLEACLVAGQALLDHAELNSETFVLRRLARRGTWQRGEHLAGSCNRSRTRLLSLGGSFRVQQDHTSLRKSSPYRTRNMSVFSTHHSSYLARGTDTEDVRMRRHDHMTTRG